MRPRTAFAIVAALFLGASNAEFADIDALERERDLEAAAVMGEAILAHPLPYTATVTQSGHGIARPVTRYYFPPRVRSQ